MRSYKLDEFVAHDSTVNCLRIGRNTAGVLATGGEDKKVNLWRIGQKEVAKSLSGLQSPVECVTFDPLENQVAAGAANGTIKVWDLESGKVSRSLTGHRSNCLSLEFHPHGPFLTSGSLDTNVKVWDLRRKEAITTFKGHTTGVKKLAISPDGKWVCSGSDNGEIKLWDMNNGRIVKDGWCHDNRITGLEFHPAEFMLATSSADRTVKVWDLEMMEQVEAIGPEATHIQAIVYDKYGKHLLTATADALKVWSCEPAVHHDTVPMDWRNLGDMVLNYKEDHVRVVACCCAGNSVGAFLVDLRKVAPFCEDYPRQAGAAAVSAGGRQQHTLQQPQPQQQLSSSGSSLSPALLEGYSRAPRRDQQQQQAQPQACPGPGDSDTGARAPAFYSLLNAAASSREPEEGLQAAGPLTRQLPRTRTPPRAAIGFASRSSSSTKQGGGSGAQQASPHSQPKQPGQLQPSPPEAMAWQQQQHRQQQSPGTRGEYFPEVEIRVPAGRPPAPQGSPSIGDTPQVANKSSSKRSLFDRLVPAAGSNARSASNNSSRRSSGYEVEPSAPLQLATGLAGLTLRERQVAGELLQKQRQLQHFGSSGRLQDPPDPKAASLNSWLDALPAADVSADNSALTSTSCSRASSAVASRVPSTRDLGAATPPAAAAAADPGAGDPILAAMAAKPLQKSHLARMVSALHVAKGFMGRGNLEGAYKAAVSQGDAAIACMLVEAVSGRADAFELNSLEPLIKLLELLLASGQEQQVSVGLAALGLVLRGPGQMVYEVCNAPKPVGVDLSFETRRSKCLLLKMALEGLGMKLGVLGRAQGVIATRAQLLAEELKRVVSAGS